MRYKKNWNKLLKEKITDNIKIITDINNIKRETPIIFHCYKCKYKTKKTTRTIIERSGFLCENCFRNTKPRKKISRKKNTNNKIKKYLSVLFDKQPHFKNIYDYSNTIYINSNIKINIFCKKCNNIFPIQPGSHKKGYGCKCYHITKNIPHKKTTKQYIKEALQKHKRKYSYIDTKYITNKHNIKVYCNSCKKNFIVNAGHHISNKLVGCKTCSKKGYSKSQIKWLNMMEIVYNTEIKHEENHKEHIIKEYSKRGTKVDGYSKELNIIFEYYGDFWHGYSRKGYNNLLKIDNEKLYQKTYNRELKLKKLGYIVISIWERYFLNHIKLLNEIKKYDKYGYYKMNNNTLYNKCKKRNIKITTKTKRNKLISLLKEN